MRFGFVIAGLLVVSNAVVAFSSQLPPRPKISATYTSTVLLTTPLNGGMPTGRGTVKADDTLKRQSYLVQFTLLGNYSMTAGNFCDGIGAKRTLCL